MPRMKLLIGKNTTVTEKLEAVRDGFRGQCTEVAGDQVTQESSWARILYAMQAGPHFILER